MKRGDKVRVNLEFYGHGFKIGDIVTCTGDTTEGYDSNNERVIFQRFRNSTSETWWINYEEYTPIIVALNKHILIL